MCAYPFICAWSISYPNAYKVLVRMSNLGCADTGCDSLPSKLSNPSLTMSYPLVSSKMSNLKGRFVSYKAYNFLLCDTTAVLAYPFLSKSSSGIIPMICFTFSTPTLKKPTKLNNSPIRWKSIFSYYFSYFYRSVLIHLLN